MVHRRGINQRQRVVRVLALMPPPTLVVAVAVAVTAVAVMVAADQVVQELL